MSDLKEAVSRLMKALYAIPYAKSETDRVKRMVEIASEFGGSPAVIDFLIRRIEADWEELPSLPTFRQEVENARVTIQSQSARRDCPVCHGYVWMSLRALATSGPNGRQTGELLTDEQADHLERQKLPATQQVVRVAYPCWACDAGAAVIAGDGSAAKSAERVRLWRERLLEAAQ